MKIQPFFDKRMSTLTYVVHDEATKAEVVIDAVLDFDPKNGRTRNESCTAVTRYMGAHMLRIPYVLDTHAHITQVQSRFRDLYNFWRTDVRKYGTTTPFY